MGRPPRTEEGEPPRTKWGDQGELLVPCWSPDQQIAEVILWIHIVSWKDTLCTS